MVATNVVGVFRETSLAGVTALLTSLLLQTSHGHDPARLDRASLPRNFLATAHAVLFIVNNVFLLALEDAQALVTAVDLRTEVLYCTSFLVAFCAAQWGDGMDHEVCPTSAHSDAACTQFPVSCRSPCPHGFGDVRVAFVGLCGARHATDA